MKNLLRISAMLVLAVLVSFSTFAQQRKGPAEQGKQMKFEKQSMLPDLTDDQNDKMEAIHLKTMKSVQPLKNSMMEKKAHLHTLTTAENASLKAINKQIDEISSIQASIQKLRAASHQEVRSILTEDQRIIFDSRSHGMMRTGGNGQHHKMKKGGYRMSPR